MDNPRYFQVEFSAAAYEGVGYKNIEIKSFIAADNECVHKIQKLQYATNEAGPYLDLATIDMTPYYNTQWVELNAFLPDDLTEEEKAKIYLRWIGDTDSDLLGTPASNATEGFYLANIFVFAESNVVDDPNPPVLLSTIPSEGSSTASANGSIVLKFDKRVKAGTDGGKIELNGEVLTPVFGSSTVTYPYRKLAYGTDYTFTIPAGAIIGMNEVAYEGSSLKFSTMLRPQPITRLFDAVVALDGSGDYTSIQEAVNAAPSGRTSPWLIFIKNGSYKEFVDVPANKTSIHLIGQDRKKTIIHEKINSQGNPENDKGTNYYENSLAAWSFSRHNPESPSYNKNDGTVVKVSGSDFYAESISFVNDWGVEAQNGPMALAMKSHCERGSFYNCEFHSYQDTWETANREGCRVYAKDCFILGAVDFIYGGGDYYFDTCTLYCCRNGAVITAPSMMATSKWGYVFESCTIDGVPENNTGGGSKLGRPWHNQPTVVYLNTTMNIKIDPEGWTNMGTLPLLFAEYNSRDAEGNPIDLSRRKRCYESRDTPPRTNCIEPVLTAEEAARITYSAAVGGADGWNPRSNFEPVAKPVGLSLDKDNKKLSWTTVDYAISYIVYQGEEAIGFTLNPEYALESLSAEGVYRVQAVNENGSLSELSEAVGEGGSSLRQDSVEGNKPVVEKSGSTLFIKNIQAGSLVGIYAVDGTLVCQKKAEAEAVSIACGALKGVYLVKIDKLTVKLVF